jgi:DNA-binding XRE family transcriptional regulator
MPKKGQQGNCLDIKSIRERLGLSQSQFAEMLGFSPRTVQSCEQGWRQPSPSLCRMATLLLIAEEQGPNFGAIKCWEETNCPPEVRDECIAYRSRQGHLCWFLTGTLCGGKRMHDWDAKQEICNGCAVFHKLTRRAEEAGQE